MENGTSKIDSVTRSSLFITRDTTVQRSSNIAQEDVLSLRASQRCDNLRGRTLVNRPFNRRINSSSHDLPGSIRAPTGRHVPVCWPCNVFSLRSVLYINARGQNKFDIYNGRVPRYFISVCTVDSHRWGCRLSKGYACFMSRTLENAEM